LKKFLRLIEGVSLPLTKDAARKLIETVEATFPEDTFGSSAEAVIDEVEAKRLETKLGEFELVFSMEAEHCPCFLSIKNLPTL
jgi:hypothetical protein